MATLTSSPAKAALPPAAPRGFTSGDEAARIVLAPLAEDEAPIVTLVGDTGTGKTTALLAISQAYLRACPGVVIVSEDKGLSSRYPGAVRRNRADLEARPLSPEEARLRTVVFRGDPTGNVDCSPEDSAEFAWELIRLGRRSLQVNDELAREEICVGCSWKGGVRWLPKTYKQGRELGLGSLAASQQPIDVPIVVWTQSTSVICFKLDAMGMKVLGRRNFFSNGVERVIPQLHGLESPKQTRGDFVLLQQGRPWNGKVYKFGVRG